MEKILDGVHGLVPREKIEKSARILRDTYSITPNAPFYQKEFGFGCLERWEREGNPHTWEELQQVAELDDSGMSGLGGLGWVVGGYEPVFSENVHHPVKDMDTWIEHCKWRLDPKTPERWKDFNKRMEMAVAEAGKGKIIRQYCAGGYMYLRSLMGGEKLLLVFYDDPDLIHDCMETWFVLADGVIARHQQHVTLDEFFIGEDICYNNGSLISPDMMREFLFPYYKKLLDNIKKRQIDKNRHLFFQVDTDGYCLGVLPMYKDELGMNFMSPFEVASGCDVVKVGAKYPDLIMSGGIDKRVLMKGKKDIDDMVDYIFPAMKKRGGYIPTCDHIVPEEVSFDNWLYFRKRCLEYA